MNCLAGNPSQMANVQTPHCGVLHTLPVRVHPSSSGTGLALGRHAETNTLSRGLVRHATVAFPCRTEVLGTLPLPPAMSSLIALVTGHPAGKNGAVNWEPYLTIPDGLSSTVLLLDSLSHQPPNDVYYLWRSAGDWAVRTRSICIATVSLFKGESCSLRSGERS